jgi:hypothetical protein
MSPDSADAYGEGRTACPYIRMAGERAAFCRPADGVPAIGRATTMGLNGEAATEEGRVCARAA